MSTGIDDNAAPASSSRHAASSSIPNAAHHEQASSLRNGIASPQSPGSEADSTIHSTAFAPSILASRLGRSIYSSTAAAGSSLSLAGSGVNSPALALTGFNAVSTVLNNPSKRQHPIDPKSSRFPPVASSHVPADIPKVKKAELEPYLSTVRPEWDRFMRNQSMGRQGKATLEQQQQQQLRSQESSHDSERLGKSDRRHRATPSIASLSADLQAVPPPQARKRLPNLSAVPQIFFAEDFDLANPYTFDQVTERYKATSSSSPAHPDGASAPTYDVALNQMLQEKLSYYSDVVEQHLIIEIGQQSSSFFAALENLNDLNAEAESCLSKIHALNSDLDHIDANQARKGLDVIRHQHRRRQLEHQQSAVVDVRHIIERRDLVRLLLQQGETEEALEILNALRSTLRPNISDAHEAENSLATPQSAGQDHISIDFTNLGCLASLPGELQQMEQSLSTMLEQDLIAILKQDHQARLSSLDKQPTSSDYFTGAAKPDDPQGSHMGLTLGTNVAATESVLTPSKPPASPFGHSANALSSDDAQLASRIKPLVIGLARTGGIENAVAAYRDVAIQAVQDAWSTSLTRSAANTDETVNWLLAQDASKPIDHDALPPQALPIRDMDHSAFLHMARSLFDVLIECLKGIDAQCKLLPRLLDELNSSQQVSRDHTQKSSTAPNGEASPDSTVPLPPTMPEGVPTNLPARLSDVVVASAEHAHTLSARLLALRAPPHAALELPSFLVVFQLCWSFVLSSEQLCRKMIVGLRGTVLSQAKGFLATFHRRRIERAAKAVEEETWAQADVGADIQAQIRLIVSSAVEDPAELVVTAGDHQRDTSTQQAAPEAAEAEPSTTSKTLVIEDRQYFVVDASLDVLSLLVDYIKVIINLPLLTTEAMARVVEFLKQFNSRTCQVVLGAGAMRSAGLKNITAKHLALASQSLSIMISLIPYIRETVRRHLPPKQAVMLTEFDKLRRDFQEHQYEIHAKLVAIMSDRLTVHCRTLSTVDWNSADKGGANANDAQTDANGTEPEPNKYAVDLVKETATLHKVLSKYLQGVVVEHVIGQVLRAIDARLAQEFETIPMQKQQAIDQMQADVRYLGTKLSTLQHVEWKDEALQQVLEAKRAAQPPAISVSASAGTSTPKDETAPGSPAVDKPPSSPFGPVTYKPRIPNIFARRQQQQQQQQQQSQSNSPRGSTDIPGTLTPSETRRSAEATPRSSLQQQPTTASQRPSQETAGVDNAGVSGPEPPSKMEGAGARSIEEEMHDVPPTPPAKNDVIQPTGAAKDGEEDVRASEDLVAPVVPAPDAVARVLKEGTPRASADLAAEPATHASAALDQEAPATAVTDDAAQAGQQGGVRKSEDEAIATAESAGESEKTDEAAVDAKLQQSSEDAAKARSSIDVSAVSSAPVPELSTPTKATSRAQGVFSGAESSPVRSGASTPATATPTGTPAKPGRMSLKERLAEAARKRAQQSAPPAPTAAPAQQRQPVQASAAPKSEAKGAEAVPEKSDSLGVETPSASVDEANATPAVSKDEAQAAEAVPEKSDAGEVDTPSAAVAEAKADDGKPTSAGASEATAQPEDAATAQPEDAAKAQPEDAAKTNGVEEASAEKEAEVLAVAAADEAIAVSDSTPASTVEASQDDAAAVKAEVILEQNDADAAEDGDGDGDGDEGEAEGGDADTHEATHDSAVSGASGAGGKKNKKKKKKGKKK
ncbi:uncharacterized protein PSANT_03235 [Moesziomyces antarcticus]|nr:uncharacterized protein PSANT_03235 [Moesziomyces antarcticus]